MTQDFGSVEKMVLFDPNRLGPLNDQVEDYPFVLKAGEEVPFPVIGDFWRVHRAGTPIEIKLDNGVFNEKSEGQSWKSPVGQAYRKVTLKSSVDQLVVMSLGFGYLYDSKTQTQIGINATDLSDLGGNGSCKNLYAYQSKNGVGTHVLPFGTVPELKQWMVLSYTCNSSFRSAEGSTAITATGLGNVQVAETTSTALNIVVPQDIDFNPIKKARIIDSGVDLNSVVDFISGSVIVHKATVQVWEYDK